MRRWSTERRRRAWCGCKGSTWCTTWRCSAPRTGRPPFFVLADRLWSQGDRLFSLGHPGIWGSPSWKVRTTGTSAHALSAPPLHGLAQLRDERRPDDRRTRAGRRGERLDGRQPAQLPRPGRPREGADAPVARPARGARGSVPRPRGPAASGVPARVFRDLFTGDTRIVTLGPFRVMTEPAPFFRCWADADREPGRTTSRSAPLLDRRRRVHRRGPGSAARSLTHQLLSTRQLNAPRFFALFARMFMADETPRGEEELVTSWGARRATCGTRTLGCVRCSASGAT